jgi:protein-disulfide isomerase
MSPEQGNDPELPEQGLANRQPTRNESDNARSSAPAWSYFLTPVAVVLGAVVVAGAIWWTDDEPVAPVIQAAPDFEAVSSAPTPGAVSPTTVLGAFLGYATQVGIDPDAFRTCLAAEDSAAIVNAHLAVGNEHGVSGTPTFFINNKRIVGSQPTEIFVEVIEAELGGSPTTIDGYSDAIKALAATSPPRFSIVDALPDLSGAAIEGAADASVTIAEFSDFQCPFCQRWTLQALPTLRSQLGDEVKLAFMHFPITAIHPNAGYAAVASICAGDQEAFWEMHDLLFARQAEWANLPVQ